MPSTLSVLFLSGACVLSNVSVGAFRSGAAPLVGAVGSPASRCSCIEPVASPRRMGVLSSRITPHEQVKMGVDLYNNDGEEIDVQTDLENIEEDIDEYYSLGDGVREAVRDDQINSKRLIECAANILLPFSQDVAFDAFSDLTRQPSWCKYLHSVQYIDEVEVDEEAKIKGNIPLRKSKWTVGVKGLRFSWTAIDTNKVPPTLIEWESTSGLKNMGSVEFVPQNDSSSTTTQMTLCFTFVMPRVLSALIQHSGKIRKYTEDVLLMNLLNDFRDVVMKEDL